MMRHSATSPAEVLTRWVFALTLIGYPFFGLVAALLNLDSTWTSIPFRIGVVILAAVLCAQASQAWPPLPGLVFLWIFWLLYLLRLVWDIVVAGIPGAMDALIFFALTVLIPCMALSRSTVERQELPIALLLLFMGGAICTVAVAMYYFQLGQERSLIEQTGRLFFEAVNPITLGYVATTALISALCLTTYHLTPIHRAAIVVAALVSFVCLMLTASRGPLIALVVCAVTFLIFKGRWRLMFLLALLVLPVVFGSVSEMELRFTNIEEDESSIERLMLQSSALTEFLKNPVAGSAFVEPLTQSYPHNLIIETALALGILGLAVLLFVIISVCLRALKRLRQGELLLPLLFAQYLIAAQLSGAIYGNAALWATMVLLFCVGRTVPERRVQPVIFLGAIASSVAVPNPSPSA